MEPLQLLKKIWAYDSFRYDQEEIIEAVLSGKDVLGIIPTGGGKSLCYQLPSQIFEHLTIVVSPLIALMNDQLKEANVYGLSAIALHSNQSKEEKQKSLDALNKGSAKILYLSPEYMFGNFYRQLKTLKISLFTIDEAHCLSQWGYDFRPSYLTLKRIRNEFINVPILVLTATATSKVIRDIQKILKLQEPLIINRSPVRSNIQINCKSIENKYDYCMDYVLNHSKEAGIIYVRTRKAAELILTFFQDHNIKIGHYHAGLTNKQKDLTQAAWMNKELSWIVSTSAFGMGVNKSNVRHILHVSIPYSLEEYIQEIGRAGRDGQLSYALILYSQNDVKKIKKQFQIKYGEWDEIVQDISDLYRYKNRKYSEISIKWHPLRLDLLHKMKVISLNRLKSNNQIQIFCRSLPDKSDYYNYYRQLLKLHPYFGKLKQFFYFNEWLELNELTQKEGLEILNTFQDRKYLAFCFNENSVHFINKVSYPTENQMNTYENLYHTNKSSIDTILQFVFYQKCYWNFISRYFSFPIIKQCGNCDNCLDYDNEDSTENFIRIQHNYESEFRKINWLGQLISTHEKN